MKLSEDIKPISYLKAHTAQVIQDLSAQPGTLVITQNGLARAVVQDIATYERTKESLALLKMLAQSTRSVEKGDYKPLRKAFKDIKVRSKERT